MTDEQKTFTPVQQMAVLIATIQNGGSLDVISHLANSLSTIALKEYTTRKENGCIGVGLIVTKYDLAFYPIE
jgi:hypothetical protein